jgi:hypothetical protein
MSILLVLGEPRRLEARTDPTFIGWLGLPNQPLPQLFLILMLYGLIPVISDFLLSSSVGKYKCLQTREYIRLY